MAVYQTIIWSCEVCRHIESVSTETDMYDDPVIRPPNKNWKYVTEGQVERLACPDCFLKHQDGGG